VTFLNDTAQHLYRVGPAVGPELPEVTPPEISAPEVTPPSAANAANAAPGATTRARAPGNASGSGSGGGGGGEGGSEDIALMREAAEAGAPLRSALETMAAAAAPGGACSCEAGVQPVCVDDLVLCACPLAYAGDRCERCAATGCNPAP